MGRRLGLALCLIGALLSGRALATDAAGGTGAEEAARDRLRSALERAQAGDAEANFEAGWYYESGVGTARDAAAAVRHYRVAAESDVAGAQFALGLALQRGEGVEKANPEQAVAWLRRAAALNHTGAINALAAATFAGSGTKRDPAAAVAWYRRSAALGDALGQYNVGYAYHMGVPEAGVAQDDEVALRWYMAAAELGLPTAQYTVGACYAEGAGAPANETEALRWFHLAAQSGSPEAMNTLGLWHSIGRGTGGADQRRATEWYLLAAESGDAKGQFVAGYRLLKGDGGKDAERAFDLLRRAAAQGHANAAQFLAAYTDAERARNRRAADEEQSAADAEAEARAEAGREADSGNGPEEAKDEL